MPGEHSGPGTPAATPATKNPTSKDVTLSSAHEMLIAVAVMSGFVIVATIIAGLSKQSGRAMLGLMLLLLLLQGIGHASPFTAWVLKHPLTPTGG